MRYLAGLVLALALSVLGCGETSGTGGSGGSAGSGGTAGAGGTGGDAGNGGAAGASGNGGEAGASGNGGTGGDIALDELVFTGWAPNELPRPDTPVFVEGYVPELDQIGTSGWGTTHFDIGDTVAVQVRRCDRYRPWKTWVNETYPEHDEMWPDVETTLYCVQGHDCDVNVPIDGCAVLDEREWTQVGDQVNVPTWTSTRAYRLGEHYYLNGFAPGRVIIRVRPR